MIASPTEDETAGGAENKESKCPGSLPTALMSQGAYNLPSLRSSVNSVNKKSDNPRRRSESTSKRKRDSSSPDVSLRRRRVDSSNGSSPLLRMADQDEPLTFDKFTRYMNEHVLTKITDVNNKVDSVSVQVSKHTVEIRSIQAELEKIKTSGANYTPVPNPEDPHISRYNLSRRSIRLWPIKGKTEDEIWLAVGNFIHDTLRVPDHEMDQNKIETVRRIRSGQRIQDEALVVFVNLESRDLVTSYAHNLAECVDTNGRPTAGLRMDIPPKLMSLFKLLENHGRCLKIRYGPEFKRHVRFDDAEHSLFLNVRLPGEEGWTRISADFVRSISREIEMSSETRNRLGYLPTPMVDPPSGRAANDPCPSTTPASQAYSLRRPRLDYRSKT